jgi:hypothetical protein
MQCVANCKVVMLCNIGRILGAFRKLRTVTSSFLVTVRLSVRMKQLSSHWADFMKFYIL